MKVSPHILRSGSLQLDCRTPVPNGGHLMGILNVTPDSFWDGGKYLDPDDAVERAEVMVRQGAALIDIGGASSRPAGAVYGEGASLIDAEEERRRIEPVISAVAERLPDIWISVDTFRAEVAARALDLGAHMINDITALRFDPDIAHVAAEYGAPMCLMHSVGLPGSMPHAQHIPDVVQRVRDELSAAASKAHEAGVPGVVLDPGFGFGKTVSDNFRLIAHVDKLVDTNHPVLVGISRKSSVGAALRPGADPAPPDDRLYGTFGATAVAVLRGATIIRTHDVAATADFLRVLHRTLGYAEL